MLATCVVEVFEAIDAGSIRFADAEARATLQALMLVAVDRLVRSPRP
mgnify:CR=1 FL=1